MPSDLNSLDSAEVARSSSNHDPDLVFNLQIQLSHDPNIQPEPFQLPPQLENLCRLGRAYASQTIRRSRIV
ncbi:MAG: hypothetical protein LH613_08915 [Chamaesiphon sp.]|nr:hypothetical protein [Chamaesiphon sp.]